MEEPNTSVDLNTLRERLLDQLAYLMDEVEALKAIIHRVPEPVQTAHPLDKEPSLKETYGLIASLDARVYLPRLQAIIAEDEPSFSPVDERVLIEQDDWNAKSIDAILAQVQDARQSLVEWLQALPPDDWSRTGLFGGEPHDVYAVAHHLTQHDADLLRTIGYRLHETNLTDRAKDLPK
jgi:hypothetical protein